MITENSDWPPVGPAFPAPGQELDDLVQVPRLLSSSRRPLRPAGAWIFAAFARARYRRAQAPLSRQGLAVRASRRVQELYLELGHATSTMVQELGRSPTVAELAAAIGTSEKRSSRPWRRARGTGRHPLMRRRAGHPASARMGELDTNFDSSRNAPCWVRPCRGCPNGSSRSCACASSKASPSRRSPPPSGSAKCTSPASWPPAHELRRGLSKSDRLARPVRSGRRFPSPQWPCGVALDSLVGHFCRDQRSPAGKARHF